MSRVDEHTASGSGSAAGSSNLPASLRGLPGPRKEKVPVIKFLLESRRYKKTKEGAKLLKEARTMLKEIRDKLDPSVRRTFDLRIEQTLEAASAVTEDDDKWPEFIYFYIIKPNRLVKSADKIVSDVQWTSLGLPSSGSETETEGGTKNVAPRPRKTAKGTKRASSAPDIISTVTGGITSSSGHEEDGDEDEPDPQPDFGDITGHSLSTVDMRSTDSVVPEDATTSTVANIITEQLGRIRVGLAFKKRPIPDDSSSVKDDATTDSIILSESTE